MKTSTATTGNSQSKTIRRTASAKQAGGKTQQRNAGNKTVQRNDAGIATDKQITGGTKRTQGTNATKQQGRQAAGMKLRPIRDRQTRNQLLATTAEDSGEKQGTVERVARSLSRTYQRHLMPEGSGQAEIPFLGAVLCREEQAARKAYTMKSRLTGRTETVPARQAGLVPTLRVHPTLKEIVARA